MLQSRRVGVLDPITNPFLGPSSWLHPASTTHPSNGDADEDYRYFPHREDVQSSVSVSEVLLAFLQLHVSDPHVTVTEFKDRKQGAVRGAHSPHSFPSCWWGIGVMVDGLSPEGPTQSSPIFYWSERTHVCPWTRAGAHVTDIKESLSCL